MLWYYGAVHFHFLYLSHSLALSCSYSLYMETENKWFESERIDSIPFLIFSECVVFFLLLATRYSTVRREAGWLAQLWWLLWFNRKRERVERLLCVLSETPKTESVYCFYLSLVVVISLNSRTFLVSAISWCNKFRLSVRELILQQFFFSCGDAIVRELYIECFGFQPIAKLLVRKVATFCILLSRYREKKSEFIEEIQVYQWNLGWKYNKSKNSWRKKRNSWRNWEILEKIWRNCCKNKKIWEIWRNWCKNRTF